MPESIVSYLLKSPDFLLQLEEDRLISTDAGRCLRPEERLRMDLFDDPAVSQPGGHTDTGDISGDIDGMEDA